jgi:hypothetical protein
MEEQLGVVMKQSNREQKTRHQRVGGSPIELVSAAGSVRVKQPLQICLEYWSKSQPCDYTVGCAKKCDKQLTYIARVSCRVFKIN